MSLVDKLLQKVKGLETVCDQLKARNEWLENIASEQKHRLECLCEGTDGSTPALVKIARLEDERDKLRAEVEALRSIALELRGWVGCADVNHRAGEFHEYDEPCKVLARIDEVLRND